jgi:hypothetical protein
VEHHVKDEEGDAKKFLGESLLVELGTKLQARKQQLEDDFVSKPASGNQSTARAAK